MMKSFLSLFLLVFFASATIVAQHKITGKVIDESGEPIPGVNVIEKENNANGTITNIDGVYNLEVSSPESTVTFSFIGFAQLDVAVASQTVIDVTLISDVTGLDEVVVTALGIKREKKALGYAVQDVKAEQLTQSGDANLVSSLQGKVAGVQINQAGTGTGGAARIEIRGASSLVGNNSPLWIVDGVPFDDGNGRDPKDVWGGTSRAGGAFDLNPEDIESVSVLKGANAAALYGERGGNGVIVVTTKKGVHKKGLGIKYAGSVTLSEAAYMLDLQDQFGQGTNGEYSNNEASSWGPKMEGQMLESWTGETIPFTAQKNRLKDFTRTGVNQSHNISMSNGNDDGSYRVSLGRNRLEGIYETHEVEKTTFDFRADYNINPWLTVDTKVSYFLIEGQERPEIGNYSYVSYFNTMPMNIRNQDLSPGYKIVGGNHEEVLYATPNANLRNPYYLQAQTTNDDVKNRTFGYISANVKLMKGLTARMKYGMDFYSFRNTEGYLWGDNVDANRPNYNTNQKTFKEQNYEFLLSYNTQLNEDFELGLNLGANNMNRYERLLSATSGKLSAETDYFLGAGSNINATESIIEQETRSMYGFGQLAYKGMVYFDFTARKDWSSTLTAKDADFDNSYFYPSLSLSGLISEMVDLPSYISFAKLRASWARVGKATVPHETSLAYTIGNWNYGLTIGNVPTVAVAQNLRSELSTSWEIGADLRFFNNRLGLDFTYYTEDTENQILKIEAVESSGFEQVKINAGLIRNEGIELMLATVPIKTANFKLGLDFNFAKNKGTLVSLEEKREGDVFYNENIRVTDYNFGLGVWAVEGGKLGDIRGTIYARDDQGRIIVDDQGLPTVDTSDENVIGNLQPDWTGSINLSADYKGVFLSALVSVQQGGDIVSSSEQGATSAGTAERTTLNDRISFFTDGVTADGNPNHVITSAEAYFRQISKVDEEFVYDASHMKLKEIALGYNVPKSLLNKIPSNPVQTARISFVGRNLLYFYKDTPGTVPDASAYSSAYAAQAYDFAPVPATRTYGFSLNIGF